jgi:hypothetical protein
MKVEMRRRAALVVTIGAVSVALRVQMAVSSAAGSGGDGKE